MYLLQQSTAKKIWFALPGGESIAYVYVGKGDGTFATEGITPIIEFASAAGSEVYVLDLTTTTTDTLGLGGLAILCSSGNSYWIPFLVVSFNPAGPNYGGSGLDAAGVRAAIGLAAADLDTQLAAIAADAALTLDAAGVRAAVGLAAADLDTQLAAIQTAASAASPPSGWPSNFDLLEIDTAGRARVQSNLTRGVAGPVNPFRMYSASDRPEPLPGLAVTGQISKDGGGYVATTNAPVALSNGTYTLQLTAGERTADVVDLRFMAAGAEPTYMTLYLSP